MQVLGTRLTSSGSVPEVLDCAAESSRVTGDLLHLRKATFCSPAEQLHMQPVPECKPKECIIRRWRS